MQYVNKDCNIYIQNTDDKVPINAGKIVKIHRFYGFGWPVRLKT